MSQQLSATGQNSEQPRIRCLELFCAATWSDALDNERGRELASRCGVHGSSDNNPLIISVIMNNKKAPCLPFWQQRSRGRPHEMILSLSRERTLGRNLINGLIAKISNLTQLKWLLHNPGIFWKLQMVREVVITGEMESWLDYDFSRKFTAGDVRRIPV